MLSSEESLFKDEEVLEFAHMPKIMKYREEEQRFIASSLKPLFQKRNGKNVLIYGKPGVGKTLALRKVVEEIEEHTDDVIPFFVNCWEKKTTFKILLDICNQLDCVMYNKSVDDMYQEIKRQLDQKSGVFVFDEIDKAEEFDFLYSLLEHVACKSLLLITNYDNFTERLEERILSRLMLQPLAFKAYSPEETEGILKERIHFAFVSNVVSKEALQKIVELTVMKADIRTGLHLLKAAGMQAESRSSRTISVEDAEKALEEIDPSASGLDLGLQQILAILKLHKELKIGDLFKKYQEQGGSSAYRTFHRKVMKLGEENHVLLDKKSGGAEGTTTIVSIVD